MEVFVYRDKDVAHEWDIRGAVPELYNTMVHLLVEDERITVVVDDAKDPAINSMVQSLRTALANGVKVSDE